MWPLLLLRRRFGSEKNRRLGEALFFFFHNCDKTFRGVRLWWSQQMFTSLPASYILTSSFVFVRFYGALGQTLPQLADFLHFSYFNTVLFCVQSYLSDMRTCYKQCCNYITQLCPIRDGVCCRWLVGVARDHLPFDSWHDGVVTLCGGRVRCY